ncbi:MAG TPA: leucine-rich repeat domain-containing protein, partial [Atopostipes sp.]|nr:leucine-rich repeat domain-containing protein [Atopostipes sp.]
MKKNYTLFNIMSLLLILLSIFLLVGSFRPTHSTVDFEDPGLEQAVLDAIEQEEGPIEPKDVEMLQVLDATGYGIESLEGIEALPELRELNLEDNYVKSVSPLQNLTKLETLSLRNNEITDLEAIDFDDILFLNIRDLSLRHNVKRDEEGEGTRLADISMLGQMVSLRKLELRDNDIENLEPLSNLRKLTELDLRENKFKDIEALETLTKLKELNLRDNEIESLEPIRHLSRLTYLNIHSDSEITSVEPISELFNLETLIMRDVPIDDQGEFLKKLTKLQKFNAIDTGFESIDPKIIVKLRQKGALQGEVRPERMLYTLEAPELSKESGFYNQGFELEIAENSEENTVYYTLDGSEPTLNSTVYEEPIQIEPNDDNTLTVVRAKVLSENNTMSETVTKSYFVNSNFDERFDLPVFSLVTDPDNLFDEEIGIYTDKNAENRGSDWERPVHLDFFETDGNLALEQELGIRIHGGLTRTYNQKSLRLYAKSEYDTNKYMTYDFFNGLEKMNDNGSVNEFKRLLLRNSGNDWNQTMFNDALMQSLIEPLGTVDTQAYRPAVVFFNGEYYGIHNIRERYDEYYIQSHYDINKEDLAILEKDGLLYRGGNSDTAHYQNMIKYIEENG